jgi:hypothetical protein
MLTHDKRGYRYAIARDICHDPVHVTDADLAAPEGLNLCGPLLTCDLLGLMALYRKREKYNRDRLRLMFNSDNIWHDGKRYDPILDRPPEQLDKKKGSDEYHPPEQGQMMVHDINAAGKRLLRRAGRYHRIRHGGWWDHKFGNARISAGLMIGAANDGLAFTPQDHILKEKLGVIVPYETPDGTEIADQTYVPDNLFGFHLFSLDDRAAQGRYFVLETDFGNEVGRPGERSEAEDEEALYRRRKSYDRMVRQLHGLIAKRLYKTLYRIPDGKPLLALFATTSVPTLNLVKDIINDLTNGKGFNWLLLKHIDREALFSRFNHPKPLTHLWTEPWERVGNAPFSLNDPERQ